MDEPGSADAGRLPDVLLIGAMKAGSTTLHELLTQHPRLFMSPQKEPGFFSRDERYARGIDWYKAHFRDARPDQMCGESSTCYSRWPHYGEVVPRIHEHLPNVKLVYLMRHPVERMYSHYRHRMTERFVRQTGPVLSFEDALAESDEYLDASLYAKQIGRFLEFFPAERLLLLTTDTLEQEPEETAMVVHAFLGIDPVRPEPLQANSFDERFGRSGARRQVRRLGESRLGSLVRGLVPEKVKPLVRGAVTLASSRLLGARRKQDFNRAVTPLGNETRQRLIETFDQPNRELELLMGRAVPAGWRS